MISLLRDRTLGWLLFGFPLAAMLLIWGIYSSGSPRELPIGLIQPDHGPLSRQLVRLLEASPLLRVAARYDDLSQASAAMQQGEVYAVVALPRHFDRDSQLGLMPNVTAWYSGQSMLSGTRAAKGIQLAIMELTAHNSPSSMSAGPVNLTVSALHNTRNHYVPFLVATALPTLWQAAIMFAAAWCTDRLLVHEQRMQRREPVFWLCLGFAVLALMPGFAVLAGIYGWLGWPMPGEWTQLVLAQVLLVLAAQGIAVALRLLSGDLLRTFSLIGSYCAPAFAFSGVTFPTQAMPDLARLWQQLLPVSHYLQLQIGQTTSGLSMAEQASNWYALALFLLAWPLVLLLRAVR